MPLHPVNPGDAVSGQIQPGRIQTLVAMLDSVTLRQGPRHPDTLKAVNELAIAFWRAGEIDTAVGLLDQALFDRPPLHQPAEELARTVAQASSLRGQVGDLPHGVPGRALDRVSSSLGPGHPMRLDALSTLGAILFEQRHLEPASEILREVLEFRTLNAGADHADSLAAKGDLAAVLFELGEYEEAGLLEREAYESAREQLGKGHPVTCVLAWHRTLSYERAQDPESARHIIVNELAWLLGEAPDRLDTDQSVIRAILVERLGWDAASAC